MAVIEGRVTYCMPILVPIGWRNKDFALAFIRRCVIMFWQNDIWQVKTPQLHFQLRIEKKCYFT